MIILFIILITILTYLIYNNIKSSDEYETKRLNSKRKRFYDKMHDKAHNNNQK